MTLAQGTGIKVEVSTHLTSETAQPGDMVVASLEDEATVKYYRPHRDRVELVAANEKYAPIVVGEHSGFSILGIVRGVIRTVGRS